MGGAVLRRRLGDLLEREHETSTTVYRVDDSNRAIHRQPADASAQNTPVAPRTSVPVATSPTLVRFQVLDENLARAGLVHLRSG